MNKELIKKRFSKTIYSYNSSANVQKQMALKLVKYTDKTRLYNSVLEIGCGTGLLTNIAFRELMFNKYTAIDIVPECEEFIKSISNDIEFVNDDAEHFIETSGKYDLIISNAAFQWIESLSDFINKLVLKLNNSGSIIFSTFGRENYREIYHTTGKSLPYLSSNDLKSVFAKFSPTIEEEIRILSFGTPLEVLRHIKNTGVNALSEELWTKNKLRNFENAYDNYCSKSPTLTYNPVYVKICP